MILTCGKQRVFDLQRVDDHDVDTAAADAVVVFGGGGGADDPQVWTTAGL